MHRFSSMLAPCLLICASLAVSAQAQEAGVNTQIDYDAFVKLTQELGPVREAHRIPFDRFQEMAGRDNAIILDTRSAAAFQEGHMQGAVNLPFSDFTDEKLEKVLGPDKNRPVLIYCNNNFLNNIAPVMSKRGPLALNIPTFINLHGYGYTNVWELADLLDFREIPWSGPGEV
ncbi:MAG: rhodanese-like domain-containing protein [Sphingomonadaceae bacterium]